MMLLIISLNLSFFSLKMGFFPNMRTRLRIFQRVFDKQIGKEKGCFFVSFIQSNWSDSMVYSGEQVGLHVGHR